MPVARTAIILGSVVLVAALAVGAGTALGAFHRVGPQFLVTTDVMPQDVRQQAADWWWIERPQKAKARLVRVHGGVKETVASADEIAGYDLDGESSAWTSRVAGHWSVQRRRGDRVETLWSGADRVGRPAFADASVIWAQTHEDSPPGAAPLPAIGPRTEVAMFADGAPIRRTGRLLEASGDIIGVRGGHAFVACSRAIGGPPSVVYDVSPVNGDARRLAAETDAVDAVLLSSGELVWTAPSRDSAQRGNVTCVRSIGSDGQVSTRSDWLPHGGRLNVSGDALYYSGGVGDGGAWSIGRNNQLPASIRPPQGFVVVGVGSKDMLLESLASSVTSMRLYTMPIR